ncbi:MAG: bis(5'-nucleosyl)-tetraphosphatase (symmetrical) YqeK [Eubacterium sp.]|nr:bis(5'-nucleosyl)-tetraphosphatase (symmetrical) YqeK [Eubacterium sp.]
MYSNDEFINIIKRRLSEARFVHSMNVAKAAAELAKKYDADEEKAYTAGILHDIMKEESLDIQYEYISRNGEEMSVLERSKSQVVHQMSGAAYCRIELGIDDEEVLSAIRYHTTGKRDMTLLQKIVYTADFISAERSYPDVEIMREKAKNSLEEAMLYSLRYTINDLASKTMLIHPDTLECYNSILENFMEKE